MLDAPGIVDLTLEVFILHGLQAELVIPFLQLQYFVVLLLGTLLPGGEKLLPVGEEYDSGGTIEQLRKEHQQMLVYLFIVINDRNFQRILLCDDCRYRRRRYDG